MTTDCEFDYIIVGSGAGGGPVAAKLARSGFSVLVLEAGEDNGESYAYRVPAFHPQASEDRDMRWDFFVRHYTDEAKNLGSWDSKYCSGPGGRGVLYPRAATLGGCTAHHAMIMLAAYDADWDRIHRITGDPSWKPDRMHEYFKRLECCRYVNRLDSRAATSGHGFDGWLPTEFPDVLDREFTLDDHIVHAAAELLACELLPQNVAAVLRQFTDDPERIRLFLDLYADDPTAALLRLVKEDPDPNDRQTLRKQRPGVFRIPMSTMRGERRGTRELLLEAQRQHGSCLKIETGALVTRVLVDDGTAVGVEYLKGPRLYRADRDPQHLNNSPESPQEVRAKRDVILAGGTFNTPQLLMLSGIGPADHLQQHGIRCVANLPGVGGNLQDRYEVSLVSNLDMDFSELVGRGRFRPPSDDERPEEDPLLRDWNIAKSGIYTTNGAITALIRRSKPERPRPDLFFMGLISNFKGYSPEYSTRLRPALTWTILKAYTNNTAGTVRLQSADPLDPPAVDFRYFEEGNDHDGEDLESLVEGLGFARKINSRLRARGLRIREVWPSSGFADDSEFIRREAWGHHACGTCKIGPRDDPRAVLASDFRVHGVDHLRVVDASVFPYIPGFFIALPIYMIAEKAADAILAAADRPAGTRPDMANK